MRVAYPVPHNLRRNFTLQPFLGINGGNIGGNGPANPVSTLLINTTFTSEVVNFAVSSFKGDYIGFQTFIESYSGPHPGPHVTVGGDLFGGCPFGLAPPVCNPGPKWAPNGE